MNIIIGFLSGVAASMGLGGGFVLIIYLTAFTDMDQLTAQGINLLFFLPIAAVSIALHAKNKLIEWKILPAIAISGLAGVAAGTFISKIISVAMLQKLFASLLIFVGIREIFHKTSNPVLTKGEISDRIASSKRDDREKNGEAFSENRRQV